MLQAAAPTGVTRERSTTRKGTARFREVKLFAVATLTSPWWGTRKSLPSLARALEQLLTPTRVRLSVSTQQGEGEGRGLTWFFLTAISFWLLEKEHTSILKKKKRGTRTLETSPPKKVRLRTKKSCAKASSTWKSVVLIGFLGGNALGKKERQCRNDICRHH